MLCSAADASIRAVAINRFNGDHTPLPEPQWHMDDNVFLADDFMPSPAFPSDHALVVAEVCFSGGNASKPPSFPCSAPRRGAAAAAATAVTDSYGEYLARRR
eukprot:COSAG01_NODE_4518_length_4960_cov_3.061716_4_plen_102_part_00